MNSAQANTAAEYRYRVDAPNSRPRTASLVALDAASRGPVRAAAALSPARRHVIEATPTGVVDVPAWLAGLPGQTRALIGDATRSDMVVLVAQSGYAGDGASLLGEACRMHGVTVTAVVVVEPHAPDDAIAATLARLRPVAGMMVVVASSDYVAEMLEALRA